MDLRMNVPVKTSANEEEIATIPQDGETAIITLIDEGLALIAGYGEPMPTNVPVLLNGDPSSPVQSIVITWKSGDAIKVNRPAFVAIVPLSKLKRGRLESVVFRGSSRPVRYTLGRRAIGIDAFLKAIANDAGNALHAIVDALVESLIAGGAKDSRLRPVVALVQAVARNDGFVEVIAHFEEGELFIQGWARELAAGKFKVIVLADTPQFAELACGTFAREDLGDRGKGYAGLLDAPQPLDPAGLRSILYRGREGWCAIEVYERRVLVEPGNAPGQIRAALPRLMASNDTLRKLRIAANRFDGRETVSQLPVPVRIGIDLAVEVEAGGILLSGWLLDPENHVETVTLRAGGKSACLNDKWTMQSRPDVSQAYRDDPAFVCLSQDRHLHGFIAFAPHMSFTPTQPSLVEITLKNGFPAYFPLSIARSSLRQSIGRLFGMLDPSSAAAANAAERQLAPMLHAAERPAPRAAEIIDIGDLTGQHGKAIVIGADQHVANAHVLLPLLALDPLTRDLPIVLAGPQDAMNEHARELRRIAVFYGLNLRLVLCEGVEDVCDALEAGIEAAPGDAVVCVSIHVLPRKQGWIAPLERAFRARGGQCIASPTLLFEDESIRWAGIWIDGEGEERILSDHYVGYPRAALAGAQPCEVTAATMECCMLSRATFAAAGGFTRGYLGAAEKALDFALKLRRAGVSSLWVPQVEMMSPEQGIGFGTPWQSLAKDIDRFAFNSRWSLAIANMPSAK